MESSSPVLSYRRVETPPAVRRAPRWRALERAAVAAVLLAAVAFMMPGCANVQPGEPPVPVAAMYPWLAVLAVTVAGGTRWGPVAVPVGVGWVIAPLVMLAAPAVISCRSVRFAGMTALRFAGWLADLSLLSPWGVILYYGASGRGNDLLAGFHLLTAAYTAQWVLLTAARWDADVLPRSRATATVRPLEAPV